MTTAKTDMNAFNWKNALRQGLIAGFVLVLVSMIGMVETFNGRFIVAPYLTMGQMLLVAIILILSSGAAAKASARGNKLFTILGGLIAGATSTVVLAVFVWVIEKFPLREIFVSISPNLIKILTFENPDPAMFGSVAVKLLLYGVVIGAIAGIVQALPARIRSAVNAGIAWVAVLGLLGELIRTVLSDKPIIENVEWMLGGRLEKGLSPKGALAIFLATSVISYLVSRFGGSVRQRVDAQRKSLSSRNQRIVSILLFAVVFVIVWQLPKFMGLYLSEVANTVGLFILMGLGLNIVVGFAGLLDLGYVAFFAIGAYVMGVATSNAVGTDSGQIAFSLGLTFWQALPLAVLAAVAAGVLLGIPVLKMRGDYLAIVTLGFGEIIRILALSDMLKPNIGGAQGIVGIAPILVNGQNLSKPMELFHVVLITCLIIGFIAWRLRDSRVGRAWKAIREDEDVAQAMGIDLVATKLLAFGTGAAFSGLAGAIFASKLTTIYPHSFSLLVSINILALVIIGGMGSIPGVIVGAVALVGLPELLREFSEYRLLVFGAALVMMMLYRPEGLLPEETHRREMHEAENLTAEQG
jgi:branched-chain amino acid transport system permease protein